MNILLHRDTTLHPFYHSHGNLSYQMGPELMPVSWFPCSRLLWYIDMFLLLNWQLGDLKGLFGLLMSILQILRPGRFDISYGFGTGRFCNRCHLGTDFRTSDPLDQYLFIWFLDLEDSLDSSKLLLHFCAYHLNKFVIISSQVIQVLYVTTVNF